MRNRRGISKNGLIVLCCVLAIVLIALMCVALVVGTGQTTQTPSEPQQTDGTRFPLVPESMEEMVISGIEERGDVMYVTTSYIDFTYPYAFSDALVIEEVNQENCVGLTVSAFIQGGTEKAYTLWINSDQGILAGTLHRGDHTYRVSMDIYDPREDMSEAYLSTFYAVQETLNDVLQSMAADGDFVYSVGGES